MFNNQNKPSGFPLTQPLGAEHDEYNWNASEMPWKNATQGTSTAVMMFNGFSVNSDVVVPPPPVPSTSGTFVRPPRIKRKSESDDFIPTKHFISEEKMVAHMNGLHLSDNYQTHDVSPTQTESSEMEAYNVNLTPQELEQRLKNAQRITVCDQVRRGLREETEIIPKVLLNRIEQPCRALVIWRPPQDIERLLTTYEPSQEISDPEEVCDNNNNDPNNNMDMDV